MWPDGNQMFVSGSEQVRSRRVTSRALVLALCSALVTTALVARGDARSDYLVRLLTTSDAFRVRAQAALSLGSVENDSAVVDALIGALRDSHPAVRAAAASSLGRLRVTRATVVLRGLSRDPEESVRSSARVAIESIERSAAAAEPAAGTGSAVAVVPSAPARFYVGVGTPGTKVAGLPREALERARTFFMGQIGALPGMVVAPAGETVRDATRILSERRLTGYYLESSIVRIERTPTGAMRGVVSVTIMTYPDRTIRSFFDVGGSVTGASEATAQSRAIEAAYMSAARTLESALTVTPQQPAPDTERRPTKRRRR